MVQKYVACVVVLSSILALGWQASAQVKTEPKSKGGDSEFAYKASEINLAEIHLGRLAIEKAQAPDVKQFAERMVADHTKSNNELTQIAAKKGFKVAMKVDAKHAAMAEELSGLSGTKFDQQYMSHMVMGHKKALAAYQQYAKNGSDEDLKAFANKVAPTVQEHLKMAERIANLVSAKGKSN